MMNRQRYQASTGLCCASLSLGAASACFSSMCFQSLKDRVGGLTDRLERCAQGLGVALVETNIIGGCLCRFQANGGLTTCATASASGSRTVLAARSAGVWCKSSWATSCARVVNASTGDNPMWSRMFPPLEEPRTPRRRSVMYSRVIPRAATKAFSWSVTVRPCIVPAFLVRESGWGEAQTTCPAPRTQG